LTPHDSRDEQKKLRNNLAVISFWENIISGSFGRVHVSLRVIDEIMEDRMKKLTRKIDVNLWN
jgi:hypothetical protein